MLAWYKLYLDSCATYHMSFVTSLLQDAKEVGTALHGNCNAGVTATITKGYWGKFHMWVNENGMVNLISIPCLEEDGYNISYDTKKEWVVTTPKGTRI